jgi:hypothetical protein
MDTKIELTKSERIEQIRIAQVKKLIILSKNKKEFEFNISIAMIEIIYKFQDDLLPKEFAQQLNENFDEIRKDIYGSYDDDDDDDDDDNDELLFKLETICGMNYVPKAVSKSKR